MALDKPADSYSKDGPSLLLPRGSPGLGHLPRFGGDPIGLLEEGARLGPLFGLRLPRLALVGYAPEWNRRLLSDLMIFRSRGSFSALTPYLRGGVILSEAPEHRERRDLLNPHFHARALRRLQERVHEALAPLRPSGPFEAVAWSSKVVQTALNQIFFEGRCSALELARFLAPLKGSFPTPFLPRPLRFSRFRRQVRRLRREGLGLAAQIPSEEVPIVLAAGYDTTAHTLAWALWHAASYPEWEGEEGRELVIKETLRLYPAGFLGSRRLAQPLEIAGRLWPAGTLVFYSPYLTHRHPDLWPEPLRFDPGRFLGRIPPWSYVPFGGGERTCLGMHMAQLVVREALRLVGPLRPLQGDPTPRAGLTLGPRGPLWLAPQGRQG
jgi:cytochrome P450